MKKIYALILAMVMTVSLVACGDGKEDTTVDREESIIIEQEIIEEIEINTSPDKYTWYIKNYVGKNLASIGYTSLGGDRMDVYGSGYVRLALVTPNGEYIDIEDEDSMKEWRVIGQNVEPNTELKYEYLLDEDGEEYDSLLAHQSIEEIVLALAPVGENADVPEMTVITPSPDRYAAFIRDYTGRTLDQCGYISMSGRLCTAYGSAYIRFNICPDDGSYVDLDDSSVLKNYVVTGQGVSPNTELTMTYLLDEEGKEYDNLIDTQNIEEIDLYVSRVNDYTDTEYEESEHIDEKEIVVEAKEELEDGMRPEFKEAMDNYEDFYDEYCEFMKQYNENPTDLTLLAEYSDMTVELVEMNEAFEEWDEEEMNNAELKYYLEVNNRVMQKLVDVM